MAALAKRGQTDRPATGGRCGTSMRQRTGTKQFGLFLAEFFAGGPFFALDLSSVAGGQDLEPMTRSFSQSGGRSRADPVGSLGYVQCTWCLSGGMGWGWDAMAYYGCQLNQKLDNGPLAMAGSCGATHFSGRRWTRCDSELAARRRLRGPPVRPPGSQTVGPQIRGGKGAPTSAPFPLQPHVFHRGGILRRSSVEGR